MIQFQRDPFSVIEENYNLIEQHWTEVAGDERKLKPHWEFFRQAEKLGNLACFTYRVDGKVVGYTVFLLQPDLHAADIRTAYNDAVFLKPEYRKGGLGKAFMQYCENQLRKMDVNMVLWHVKPSVDFSGALRSMGYRHFSTLFAKNI